MKKEYILFIDSGVGGLSILGEVYKIVPANFIYFADNKNCPYGEHSKHEIFLFLKDIITKVTSKFSVKLVVLACNTATTSSIEPLRKHFTNLTFIGTEPAIKLASDSGYHNILVLSTPATAKQQKYKKLKRSVLKSGKNVHSQTLPDFAKNIENYLTLGNTCSWLNLQKNLYEIKKVAQNYDCVVLGCTHYPLVHSLIEKFVQKPLVSGTHGVAQRVFSEHKNLISNELHKNLQKKVLFFFSSNAGDMKKKYIKIFKQILANNKNVW